MTIPSCATLEIVYQHGNCQRTHRALEGVVRCTPGGEPITVVYRTEHGETSNVWPPLIKQPGQRVVFAAVDYTRQ